MAEIFQSLETLELFFADFVTSTLGMVPENVRIQYQELGQMSNRYKENFAFIKVTPELDERAIFKNRKRVYDPLKGQFAYTSNATRTITLHVVFYGPGCYENCYKFNELMYTENSKLLLKIMYLSAIPDRTNGPTRFPEMHNGKWWPRADIELRFYNAIEISETVNSFNSFDIRTEAN